MKIVLATPLYPPDIAQPAPYVKELAKRLSTRHANALTIVTYGKMPETVPDVSIVTVSKQQPLPLRLIAYTFALWNQTRGADVIYSENGASVELPVALVTFLQRTRLIFHIGDAAAHEHAQRSKLYGMIERFVSKRSQKTLSGNPLERPEILPFVPYPADAFAAYERSWDEHLHELETILIHA